MNKVWSDDAWEEYIAWQMQDKKTLKRINLLLKMSNVTRSRESASLSRSEES